MINTKPSRAVEKKWLDRVAAHGCVITGNSQCQIHHPIGREGKSNKYHIGRFFCYGLSFELHDVSSNHPFNVTHHRKAFVGTYGKESRRFELMCEELVYDGPLPFDDMVMSAILATGR